MADLSPVRGQHGKYAVKPSTAELDAECCRLRTTGKSYREVAAILGVSMQRVHQGVHRGMATVLAEPAAAALAFEIARLDELHVGYLDQYTRYGNSIAEYEAELQKLRDGGEAFPVMPDHDRGFKALQGLLKVGESRRKLLGLDQPAKVQVAATVEYTINGVNPKDLT